MIYDLTGKWLLVSSNFPMWKGSDICNVTFNYAAENKSGRTCLLDEVKYTKGNKSKSIRGYDFEDPKASNKFTWRGSGWLFFVTSKWSVEWISDDENCMVISFEKSLFTPAGVDVLTRQTNQAANLLEQAFSFIKSNAELNQKARGQFSILQQ